MLRFCFYVLVGCTARPVPPVTVAHPDDCHGERRPLVIARQMPLVAARVSGAEGLFILDTATTGSTLDPAGFAVAPVPLPGTTDRYAPFDFFGSWGTVTLARNDHRGFAGDTKVSGLIGTDFLSLHTYTFDYANSALYRAGARDFCPDASLVAEGLRAMSSEGYYAADVSRLRSGVPNVPTIPIRIAGIASVAQIDTAYTDTRIRHSVNINRALFDAIVARGIKLERGEELPLTTCVPGVTETTIVYRGKARFEMVAADGTAARVADDATYLLKESPKEAAVCGGIGTWSTAAAQIGASFYVDAGKMVFDPFTSRVWISGG